MVLILSQWGEVFTEQLYNISLLHNSKDWTFSQTRETVAIYNMDCLPTDSLNNQIHYTKFGIKHIFVELNVY